MNHNFTRQQKRRVVLNLEKVTGKLHQGQKSIVKEVMSGQVKYVALMAHRRYGKDFIAFLVILLCALKYPGNYYLFAPYFRQAKEIVVDGKTMDGTPLVETLVDKRLLKKPKGNVVNKSDWSIELFNNSKIFIRGADNPNSNVGVGARGIVYTEAALMKPGFYEYMKPAINTVINKTGFGIVFFISTPRGKNNWFTELFKKYFTVLDKVPNLKKKWYVDIQRADQSLDWKGDNVISQEQLQQEALEMTPEMYAQEWLCSTNVNSVGAWYSKELDIAYKEKRIGRFGQYIETAGQGIKYKGHIIPQQPIYIGWDIGKRDHTVLWFSQINPKSGRLRMIHHYRVSGQGAAHMVEYIKRWMKNNDIYDQPLNILPHDGDNEEWTSSTRRSQYLMEQGLRVFTLSKTLLAGLNMGLLINQINSIRQNFHLVEIDNEECSEGVIKLSEYVKKRNKQTGEWVDVPDHDANGKASDDADAFRTMMIYYLEFLNGKNIKEKDISIIASDAIGFEDEVSSFMMENMD